MINKIWLSFISTTLIVLASISTVHAYTYDVQKFSDGLSLARTTGEWSQINNNGELVFIAYPNGTAFNKHGEGEIYLYDLNSPATPLVLSKLPGETPTYNNDYSYTDIEISDNGDVLWIANAVSGDWSSRGMYLYDADATPGSKVRLITNDTYYAEDVSMNASGDFVWPGSAVCTEYYIYPPTGAQGPCLSYETEVYKYSNGVTTLVTGASISGRAWTPMLNDNGDVIWGATYCTNYALDSFGNNRYCDTRASRIQMYSNGSLTEVASGGDGFLSRTLQFNNNAEVLWGELLKIPGTEICTDYRWGTRYYTPYTYEYPLYLYSGGNKTQVNLGTSGSIQDTVLSNSGAIAWIDRDWDLKYKAPGQATVILTGGPGYKSAGGELEINAKGDLVWAGHYLTAQGNRLFPYVYEVATGEISLLEETASGVPMDGTYWGSLTPALHINDKGTATFTAWDVDNRIHVYLATNNTAPVANAGPDQVVEATGIDTSVTLDGAGSTDVDGDALTYTWTGLFGEISGVAPTVSLDVGVHTITLVVDDGNGETATDTVVVTVQVTTPEALAAIINDALDEGLISSTGIATSLLAKIDQLQYKAAINQLEAQYGKKVAAQTADQLIGYMNDIIASQP